MAAVPGAAAWLIGWLAAGVLGAPSPPARVPLPHPAISSQGGLPAPEVPDPRLVEELGHRRRRLLDALQPGAVALLMSHPPQWYSGDTFYEYRQANNLYYLTGINRQDTALLLLRGETTSGEILFLPEPDPRREAWTGHMLTAEEVRELSGIEEVRARERLEPFLADLLGGRLRQRGDPPYRDVVAALEAGEAVLYLDLEPHPGLEGEPPPELALARRLQERFMGFRTADLAPILHRLRAVKSSYEIDRLRRAVQITVEAQRRAMAEAAPGRWEYEVEALVEYVFKLHNAAVGFPSIIASGPNATTLHYEESQRQMRPGDLLLVDIGAEVDHYTADVTRTFPVSGRFSPEQRAVYELVLRAQLAAEELLRPDTTMAELQRRATEVLAEGLLELGLITEKSPEQIGRFWLHGIGHPIGLQVHDVWGGDRTLRPGQVITVEPGIYVRPDTLEHLSSTPEDRAFAEAVRPAFERYRGIGVRIEDDYLITPDGFEHLSSGAPRTVPEIEALTAGGGSGGA